MISLKYFIVFYRSVFFYVIVAFLYRLMGKREIGELSIMDFIVSIFIAEMVAISIENYDQNMFLSLIPIGVLVGLQILISHFSMKHSSFRKFMDGKPSIMIDHGKINFHEMKRQRYNLDDLLIQLRGKSIKSIDEVDYAVLETNGKLSIFLKQDDLKRNYPLPLIVDGVVEEEVLKRIQKSKEWLEKELEKQNLKIEDIFYCFYKDEEFYMIENSLIK